MDGPDTKPSWVTDLSNFLIGVSLLFFGFSGTTSLWFGVTVGTPTILGLMLFVAFVSGVMLLLLNALLAAFAKGRRLVHGILMLLVVAAFLFFESTRDWHIDKRHQWFVQEEIRTYEEMVQSVLRHRAVLEGQPRDLKDIVKRPGGVYGRTNADGSILVLFPGGEAGPRHGRLYCSGSMLVTNPVHEGEPILHLTNGWYEY